ncbi:hypothetical protein LEP3755_63890 (plasmid) [Leptolyngbya sp. NIES-3755]|nr:hypothetical protein LEP3755_63890 [Leptolyngbya sp. NIES-3755]
MKQFILATSTLAVLATASIFSTSSAIATSSNTLTTSGMPHAWQNALDRNVLQSSKTAQSIDQSKTSVSQTSTGAKPQFTNPVKSTKCSGDAARSTPPVVNNPTHIRNVIWRNMRARCL